MEEQKSVSKSVVATISVIAGVAILGGAGLALFTIQNQPQANAPNPIISSGGTDPVKPAQLNPATITPITIPPNPPGSTSPTTPAEIPAIVQKPTDITPATKGNVKVFWLDDLNGKKIRVAPQERKIARSISQNPASVVKESLTILLASAGKEDKQTSTIPAGTRLLSSKLESDGIHIDLSKEFTQGGGSTSMQGRLAQILYTATNQNVDIPVWISVEGKAIETLGGEGVEIKQPLTRQSFQAEFKDSVGEQ